jgi:hypothetical protein
MKNRNGFNFGLFLLIVLMFVSLISCELDEIIVDNYNIFGKWKYVDVSDSIDHYEHLLIFESDSTFQYKISNFKYVTLPGNIPGPIYGLYSTDNYVGNYSVNGNNLNLNADSIYFWWVVFDWSLAKKIDISFYDECKFMVVDTLLTINYTTYKENKPITKKRTFVKYDDAQD